MINKEFKQKPHDQKVLECSVKRVQTKEGKWNLQNKETSKYISDIWFDNLGLWNSFSCINGEHDIFGWDGMVFLEEPTKTPKSAYPYSVKATIYHYNCDGELLNIGENTCGIWGYGYLKNVKY